MTFLQRTLGRNYKWWYIISYEFKRGSAQISTSLINMIIKTVEFLIIIYIWKFSNSFVSTNIITYLVIGRVFDKITYCEIEGQISYMVIKGGLTRFLLLPTNFLKYMVCNSIGFNFVRTFINSFVIFIFALLLFQKEVVLTFNILQLIPFFFIAYILKIFWSFIMGSISFWCSTNSNSSSLIDAARTVSSILSGSIIPLYIIFTGIFTFLLYTPFTFLLHHPMQIYLGKYDSNQTLQTFAGGIAWCLMLWILARLIFKVGLKRNEAVGL
jgi:ABC-2 type transport system permease protein